MYVYGYSCRYEEDEEEKLRGKVNRNWKIYIKGTLNALSSTTNTFRNIYACFVKCEKESPFFLPLMHFYEREVCL